jgi:hypothetical protein
MPAAKKPFAAQMPPEIVFIDALLISVKAFVLARQDET